MRGEGGYSLRHWKERKNLSQIPGVPVLNVSLLGVITLILFFGVFVSVRSGTPINDGPFEYRAPILAKFCIGEIRYPNKRRGFFSVYGAFGAI